MANNNETTTKFKVDISELKKAMQEAKRSIAVANSEFKAVSSSMDDWSKSTDGISAKLKQLDTTLSAQETVLANLEAQYEAVVREQGENSKAADDLIIKINNQKAAINNTQKQINKWSTALNELQAESNQTETATQSLNNLIGKQQKELTDLKEKYKNLVLEQGDSTEEARQLASQITNLSGELNDNRTKLQNAANAADDLDQSLDDAGDGADDANSGFTVLKGTIANLAAEAISKAVDALKDFVSQANEVDKAINGLQTSTGATAKEMKQYEKVMKEIYNANYGESYDDVAASMSQVLQTMGDLSDVDLKNITTNGLALRDTFGFEMNESMRAVNSLMKQFGITSTEAYNLIAQGAQNGLNQNGDLLDVINEYSVQFKNSGYNANEMFNMLKNGADAGVWSVDKLGDAVKEMNIRFSDGTVAEALAENAKALGLSQKEVKSLQKEYNKGGDSAQKAVGKMIDSILNVKDETKQYQLGVSVFGTMWEDLGAEAIKALMSTKGELTSTKKTMDDIKNTKYNDLGSSLQQLGRMFKDEILKPIADHIMPKLQEFVNYAIKNFASIKKTVIDAGKAFMEWLPTLKVIGAAIAAYLVATKIIAFVEAIKAGTIALKLMTAAQTVFNTVMSLNPIGLVVAAIAALVAAFVILWKKSEAFRNFWIGLWDGLVAVVQKIVDFFKNNWQSLLLLLASPFAGAFKLIYDNCDGFRNFIDGLVTTIKTFFVNLGTKIANVFTTAWSKIVEIFSPAINWFSQLFTSIFNTLKTTVEVIKGLIKGTWTLITTVFGIAANWFKTTVIDPVAKVFNTLWTGIKSLASTTWEGIKAIFGVVKTWFTNNVSTPLTTVFTTIWNTLKTGATNAWNGIKTVFSTVGTFFKDTFTKAWTAVKNVFSTGGKIFDGIKEGIVSMFKTIVNAIIRGINKVVSVPFNAINSALDTIRNVGIGKAKPFSGLPTISVPSIPELARGGILKRGQVGLLEGDGAEAVVPLEKNTQWLRAVAKQMARELGLSGSSMTSGSVGLGGVVNNYNQTINSPKALTRLEIYRQSKNLLAFNGGVY